jgi:beta-glucanase (GH16 family)
MKLYFICLFTLLMSGCGGDEPEQQLTPPANLTVQVNINPDNSGKVVLVASAQNANFFNVYFGETPNETPFKTNDGKASWQYAASGNYTVRVQAHVTDDVFITETKNISITRQAANGGVLIPTTGYSTPETYAGMNLVWRDEFEGASLNTGNWTFETGTGTNGWGNNELQYYRQENTSLQNGFLVIAAKKETFQGRDYTSSRIITKDKRSFRYGRVDIRAALPKGQGIWPALWMLGSNIATAPWPACGEIDIMEMVGGNGRENTIHGTAHWDNNGQHANYGQGNTLTSGIYADEFHVFSIVWTETSIKWYRDDILYNTVDVTPAGLSEFKNEFFFVFNVAVGGNWPGSPDTSTAFPQNLIVDYIRVFQ